MDSVCRLFSCRSVLDCGEPGLVEEAADRKKLVMWHEGSGPGGRTRHQI